MLECFFSLIDRVQKLGCWDVGNRGKSQEEGTSEKTTAGWKKENWPTANMNDNTNTFEKNWKEQMFDSVQLPRLIFDCLCCPLTPQTAHKQDMDVRQELKKHSKN